MVWDIVSSLNQARKLELWKYLKKRSPVTVLLIDDREDCMATLDIALERMPGSNPFDELSLRSRWEELSPPIPSPP